MHILINYHGTDPIGKISVGDWIDLRAAEDVDMRAGEYKRISLGVSMKLPEGYEAHVSSRSSTYETWGILMTNSMGIIDNSYSGDNDIWLYPALAMRDTHIHKGDRIAQFRIVKKQPEFELVSVDYLADPDRGGLGSTGTR